jgi:hypothetical protein
VSLDSGHRCALESPDAPQGRRALNRFASLKTGGSAFAEATSVECSLATQLAAASRLTRAAWGGPRGWQLVGERLGTGALEVVARQIAVGEHHAIDPLLPRH